VTRAMDFGAMLTEQTSSRSRSSRPVCGAVAGVADGADIYASRLRKNIYECTERAIYRTCLFLSDRY
jgi:hypothetical protein